MKINTDDFRKMIDRSKATSSKKTVASSAVRMLDDTQNPTQAINAMFPMILEMYLGDTIREAIAEQVVICQKTGTYGRIAKNIGWPTAIIVIVFRFQSIVDTILGAI